MKKGKLKYEMNFESLPGISTMLHLRGSRELLIENHRGISDYGPELIAVAARGGSVTVTGSGLRAEAMNSRQILISGKIHNISFGGGNDF